MPAVNTFIVAMHRPSPPEPTALSEQSVSMRGVNIVKNGIDVIPTAAAVTNAITNLSNLRFMSWTLYTVYFVFACKNVWATNWQAMSRQTCVKCIPSNA